MEAPSSEKPRKCKCRQTANILTKSGQLCCNRSRERDTPGFQIHLQMLEMGVEGPRASTAPRRARGQGQLPLDDLPVGWTYVPAEKQVLTG